MSESATNSSTSASGYFWKECHPYNDKSGLSAGLLILFTTDLFELLLAPLQTFGLSITSSGKNFFPLHLALTQLSFFLVLPLLLINHFLLESESVLAVVTILTSMVVVMKPLLLCLVCVERYMAVVRPIDYLRYKAGWYRWGCLGVLWCIYIPMASSAIYEHSSSTISVVFLPVLIIGTFCSMSVLKTLRKPPPGDRQMAEREKKGREKRKAHKNGRHVVSVEREEQERSSKKEEKVKGVRRNKPRGKAETNSMKRKAFVIIAVIQAVLTLNYLPMIICVFLEGRVPARVLKCQYLALGLAAAVSCSYLQPLLYLHKLGRLSFMKSQNT